MSIKVKATIGIGGWTISNTTQLCTCPHAGDIIEIDGVAVTCERVYIGKKDVHVRETVRFQAESDMDEYVKLGWKK